MHAYFDCFSGISGDMTLGALIDLGVPPEWLQAELSRLPLTGFQLAVTATVRNGISANLVNVEVHDSKTSRDFKEIKSLLENCPLSEAVKSTGLNIFEKLARAEAAVHGCAPQDVHFHELGGVDAIVDIVGTALGLEKLGIKKVTASKLPLGSGFVDCQHGKLPVPAPATIEILKEVPVYGTETTGELVTPTGAAIIASLAESFGPLPEMQLLKTGYGVGQRELQDRPNLLRVITGIPADLKSDLTEALHSDQIIILETCIDDMNPELFGFLMERVFEDGALDAYWIPVHMKKNRPGTMVQVLCKEYRKDALIRRLLAETTSLGVRYYSAHRQLLARDELTIATSLGKVRVKRIKDPEGNTRLLPEYEVCREVALQKKIPLRVVYDIIAREAAEK
ncbi:MAG: nickel pincer cofactor biosynthesis protein LarC [Desulfobacterales bacterium]|jgi:hypothetical protein